MHLVLALLINSAALIITANLVPGFNVDNFTTALFAAIILGFINTFIRPFLMFVTAPLNFVTLGLFVFIVNAVILWFASIVIPGLMVDSMLSAVLAAIVLSLVSTAISWLMSDIARSARNLSKK